MRQAERQYDLTRTDCSKSSSRGKRESAADQAELVEGVLFLQTLLADMVASLFEGSAHFAAAAREALEACVNKRVGKFSMAEMLAAYCDKCLKVVFACVFSIEFC